MKIEVKGQIETRGRLAWFSVNRKHKIDEIATVDGGGMIELVDLGPFELAGYGVRDGWDLYLTASDGVARLVKISHFKNDPGPKRVPINFKVGDVKFIGEITLRVLE